MPDIAAIRPVSGQPIETAWGDQVHDALEGIQTGVASVALSNAVSGATVVTFARPYATPPVVVVAQASNTSATFAIIGATTTTTVTVVLISRTGTAITTTNACNWIAIGEPG